MTDHPRKAQEVFEEALDLLPAAEVPDESLTEPASPPGD